MKTLQPHADEVLKPFVQQPALEREEYWALWRGLTERAGLLLKGALILRDMAKEKGLRWHESLREGL